MRNYLKKKDKEIEAVTMTADELIAKFARVKTVSPKFKVIICACVVLSVLGLMALVHGIHNIQMQDVSSISLAVAPISATSSKRDLISIPSGTVKANPFVPYRVIEDSDTFSDVPKFELVAPPETLSEGSDAARVMDTIVSGILYDKHSPSAILNIEGNDYLVKKGDVVNNYKVMNIEQNSVTVKLGNNTFKAGIGEILTEGSVNYNDVSNLSKKFGGERR